MTAWQTGFDGDTPLYKRQGRSHNRVAKGATGRTDLPSQQRDGNWSTLAQNNDENPLGAPPLDWWLIDPNTFDPSKKDGPMSSAKFIVGDTREITASLADGSVDLILTSPPFLALRSYLPADHPDKGKEIGSEANPAAFIDVLLELTAEWRRILAPHGSICIELGDTYSGSGGAGGDYGDDGLREGQPKFRITSLRNDIAWPLPKCLALVPELYRVALAYGINPLTGAPSPAGRWRVRNVVRWVRPNPPVGALGDKFRPATSDLVIACVAGDRWFDLDSVRTGTYAHPERIGKAINNGRGDTYDPEVKSGWSNQPNFTVQDRGGPPPLDWWQIVPGGYSGAHYAVWPPTLCERPIEAMCPRRVCRECGKPSRREVEKVADYATYMETKAGRTLDPVRARRNHEGNAAMSTMPAEYTTVGWSTCGCPNSDGLQLDGYHTGTGWRAGLTYDPFAGSGTTLVVAHGHSRDSIGADLDPRNAMLAAERLGMFLTVETTELVV